MHPIELYYRRGGRGSGGTWCPRQRRRSPRRRSERASCTCPQPRDLTSTLVAPPPPLQAHPGDGGSAPKARSYPGAECGRYLEASSSSARGGAAAPSPPAAAPSLSCHLPQGRSSHPPLWPASGPASARGRRVPGGYGLLPLAGGWRRDSFRSVGARASGGCAVTRSPRLGGDPGSPGSPGAAGGARRAEGGTARLRRLELRWQARRRRQEKRRREEEGKVTKSAVDIVWVVQPLGCLRRKVLKRMGARSGGTWPLSMRLQGRGRRIRSSKPASAAQQVPGPSGLFENLSQKETTQNPRW